MSGGISVRNAAASDAPFIASAEAAYIDCPWTEVQIAEEIASASAVFLVAECDGSPCGYVSGSIAADECEVSNIAVSVQYRRRGVATALLKAFTAELKLRGVKHVFLLVRDGNAPAYELYRRNGFCVVGRRTGYYKGKDALIMRLNL